MALLAATDSICFRHLLNLCGRAAPRAGASLCVALNLLAGSAYAIDCPKMPEQTKSDLATEVEAAVVRIGPAKGAELAVRTKTATLNLLGRLPEADRVYLEQMMYAAYCSGLKADASLKEAEKAALIRAYNREVRMAIRQNATNPSSGNPGRGSGSTPRPPEKPSSSPSKVPTSGASNTSDARTADSQFSEVERLAQDLSKTQLTVHLTSSGFADPGASRQDFNWSTHVSLAEVHELVFPHLVGRPHELRVRNWLAESIAERHLASTLSVVRPSDHRLRERSFQEIALELRSHRLVSIEYLKGSDGSFHLFWLETALGTRVLDVIRRQNRASEQQKQSASATVGSDPQIQAEIDREVQRRVSEINVQIEAKYGARIQELERQVASQVSRFEVPLLDKQRRRFYVEEGQVWTRVDQKLLSIDTVGRKSMTINSVNSSKELGVADEWVYYYGSTACYLALVQLEARRALVEHYCR